MLTGILVSFTGGKLVMAATDSYRLAVKETELDGSAPELEAIVPSRALQELARIASHGDTVEVGVHENQVLFSTDGAWLTTRRIDGQFPNYRQLLPEQFEHELTLPRTEILEVVRRASVMIQRATPLQLRFAEGELTVIARTHEVGESQESMPVALLRRDARDRLQRRLPARRARVDGRRRRALQADQPAAAGGAAGRERRLHVPRHADPPAGLASTT